MPHIPMMAMPKFKKALEGLPENPAIGAVFTGFQATKKGNATDFFFGFYIDQAMQAEFKQDKNAGYYDTKILQGVIQRSAKFPLKRIIISLSKPSSFNAAMARELRLIVKPMLRDNNIKYVITFVKDGDLEPDPTPEELTELQAISDSPARPTKRANLMDQPGVRPRIRPPTKALDVVEYELFTQRVESLAIELKLVPEMIPRVQEASRYAKAHYERAHDELDSVERELALRASNDNKLKIATMLRETWATIVAEKWDDNPKYVAIYKHAVERFAAGDGRGCLQALQPLQQAVSQVKEQRDIYLRNQIFKNPDFTAKFDPDALAEKIASDMKLPEDVVTAVLATKFRELKQEAKALRPKGFRLHKSKWVKESATVNPLLPGASRPQFTVDEALALNAYSDANYDAINTFVRNGAPPLVPPNDKTYADLKLAFAKAKPFPQPVVVSRGMNFKTSELLDAFLDKCYRSMGTGELFSLLSFVSTGTAGVPVQFDGNVMLKILAKQGLDLQPYTKTPKERELLLNEHTMVYASNVAKQPNGKYIVLCEQVLPIAKP